jgi:hypothetical protein
MIDPKRTFAEIQSDLVRSLKQRAETWQRHETAQATPDARAHASRIRRFLESVARFAEYQG